MCFCCVYEVFIKRFKICPRIVNYPVTYLEHAGAVQRAPIVVPVVRREGAVVGTVPGVVQRVAGVTFVAVDFQFVVVLLGMDLEMGVLCVPVVDEKS